MEISGGRANGERFALRSAPKQLTIKERLLNTVVALFGPREHREFTSPTQTLCNPTALNKLIFLNAAIPLRLLLQPLLLVLLLFFLFLLLEALLGWPAPQIGRRGALYTV